VKGFKANLREDADQVLGSVSDEYEVVENIDAFRCLDALIGSELHFETAGSVGGAQRGRRAPRLRTAPQRPDQPGPAVLRGHDTQAARARTGHGG
jgi:uncharacterized protein DUF932